MIPQHTGDLRGTHVGRVPAEDGVVGCQDSDGGSAVQFGKDACLVESLKEPAGAQEREGLG